MGGRYFITGVQLGMLISVREPKGRKKIIEEIEENQFIANLDNKQEREFGKIMKEVGEKLTKEFNFEEKE